MIALQLKIPRVTRDKISDGPKTSCKQWLKKHDGVESQSTTTTKWRQMI
jgi:hypothetical protein